MSRSDVYFATPSVRTLKLTLPRSSISSSTPTLAVKVVAVAAEPDADRPTARAYRDPSRTAFRRGSGRLRRRQRPRRCSGPVRPDPSRWSSRGHSRSLTQVLPGRCRWQRLVRERGGEEAETATGQLDRLHGLARRRAVRRCRRPGSPWWCWPVRLGCSGPSTETASFAPPVVGSWQHQFGNWNVACDSRAVGVDDRHAALGVQTGASAQQCQVRTGAGHQDRRRLVLHQVRRTGRSGRPGELRRPGR